MWPKHTFILFGDQTDVLAPIATYAQTRLHAKSAIVIYPQEAGPTTAAADVVVSMTKAEIKSAKIGVSPTATDLTAPLTAANASSTSVLIPM